jgi:predicted RNase H-like HicB family nuclease
MNLPIELEQEEDGRWIAEVTTLSGVMVYGQTREEAIARVEALTLRVLADRLEHGESVPELDHLFSVVA